MSAARKHFQYPGEFEMRRGSSLRNPTLAYETWGTLSPSGDNAVLIFTGLSPSAHASSSPADPAPGWWEEIVGPSRPVDTRRLFVICVNSLGSCFGSTGPASNHPDDAQPYRLRFPVLTLEDISAAGKALLGHLGIARLHALIGPSMGGMTALAFAVMYPDIAERLLLISTAPRSLPFAIALRSLQREMIRRDPDWKGGEYAPGAGPITGMRLARKLGMMTYRSAQEWEQRFGRERIPEERQSGDPFAVDFEIEAYLEAHAQKFTGQFDANCYLYLSRAMDLFDLYEHGGSLDTAIARIRARHAMVIGVATDFLFPIHQQRELAHSLRHVCRCVDFRELPSIQGHDSFLVDMDRFRPAISDFLAQP
jgi:homoserine O-acetyltransferase